MVNVSDMPKFTIDEGGEQHAHYIFALQHSVSHIANGPLFLQHRLLALCAFDFPSSPRSHGHQTVLSISDQSMVRFSSQGHDFSAAS